MLKSFFDSRFNVLILGIILGTLIYLGPSIILSLLILLSIFLFISRMPFGEKNVLTKIIVIAFILRLLFFSITMYLVYCLNADISQYPERIVGHTIQLVRDFDREIKNGIALGRYLGGEFGNIPVKGVSVHSVGFLHAGAWTQGVMNYIFGTSFLNLLLFPIIDLWAVVCIFCLAKSLFDEKVASFSSFIYAIMPSSIGISCTNVRFSLSIFSLLLVSFFLVQFAKTNNFKFLLLLFVGVIIFIIYREKAAKPLLLILPVTLFLALNIGFLKKVALLIVFISVFFILLSKSVFLQQKSMEMLRNIVASQTGFNTEIEGVAYSNYKIYDEIVYNTDIKNVSPLMLIKMFPKALFKGIFYFMLVPFPWELTSTARLYYYPQIIFWYFIIPFGIFGMIKGLFLKVREALPVILLCGYFIVLLSLVLGNEGIAARYRELITPFFYIFAGSLLCRTPMPRKEDLKTL